MGVIRSKLILLIALLISDQIVTNAMIPRDGFSDVPEFLLKHQNAMEEEYLPSDIFELPPDSPEELALASITPLLGTFLKPISETCKSQSMTYLSALFSGEDWAQKMFDSNGKRPNGMYSYLSSKCLDDSHYVKYDCEDQFDDYIFPVGHQASIGSFSECLGTKSPPGDDEFKAQFCTMSFQYSGSERKQELSLAKRNAPLDDLQIPRGGAYWMEDIMANLGKGRDTEYWSTNMNQVLGICIPSGCSVSEIQKNYQKVYEGVNSILNGALTEIPYYPGCTGPLCNISHSCVTADTFEDYPSTISSDLSRGQITFFTVLGAIILLMGLAVIVELANSLFLEPDATKPFFVKLILCFSPYANLKGIAKTTDTNAGGQIGCLNGMRAISMTWVVLCHSFLYTPGKSSQNNRWVYDIQRGDTSVYGHEVIANGYYNVDTFFFMSGLLVAYLALIELERKRFNLVMFYVLRYIRLTIPLALVIGFNITISQYFIADGPLSFKTQYNGDLCESSWWQVLLYITNLTGSIACLGQTWYLMCDMQLFFCAPLVILPLYYWEKNFYDLGLKLWLLVITFFSLVPMAITVVKEMGMGHGIGITPTDTHGFDTFGGYYAATYVRAQPYIYGILIGYVLFKMRGKKLDIHWTTNVFLWLIAFVIGWECVFGISHLRMENKIMFPPWSTFEAGVYEGLSRLAWSVALGWVVIACAKDKGGLINKFLSWGVFQPIAKISYMTYLTHLSVMNMLWNNSRTYGAEPSYFYQMYSFVGVTSITFAISIVFMLLFESPFMHLQKLLVTALLGGGSKKPKSDTKTDKNGTANGRG